MNLFSTGEGDAGFLLRLAIDVASVFLLIRGVYYRTYRRADLFLTFFSFNLVIFLIAYVLNSVEMTLGAAFGLFAVFSMIRYRTEGIETTDMTYLFLGIALGLIMAIAGPGWQMLLLVSVIVLGSTLFLETSALSKREVRQRVFYDRADLVRGADREALLADLRERTGLPIHRVEVQEMDLIRDSAKLAVYYYPNGGLVSRAAVPVTDDD
jgi:hypothetical protein